MLITQRRIFNLHTKNAENPCRTKVFSILGVFKIPPGFRTLNVIKIFQKPLFFNTFEVSQGFEIPPIVYECIICERSEHPVGHPLCQQ